MTAERDSHEFGCPLAWVAGATGYTGRAVVRELGVQSIPTVAHVRPDSPRSAEFRREFEAVGAQLDSTAWEPEALAGRFREVRPSLVFALLGTTSKRARSEGMAAQQAYARVDFGLTNWLVEAAVASGARPRFVYLSSAGVRPGSTNPYLAARVRAEQALRDSGLPFTIVRPSFISGPDRPQLRPLERGAAMLTDAVLGVAAFLGAGRLRDRFGSIDAATLARALVRIARDPQWENRVAEAADLREPDVG